MKGLKIIGFDVFSTREADHSVVLRRQTAKDFLLPENTL